MTLRPLTPLDRDAVAVLVRAAFHADYRTTAEVLAGIESPEEKVAGVLRELSMSPSRFHGAVEGGGLVGLAVVREDALGRLWLDDIFVDSSARRAGVARALLDAVLPRDREVLCEVNGRNGAALATFRALGFAPVLETVVLARSGAAQD